MAEAVNRSRQLWLTPSTIVDIIFLLEHDAAAGRKIFRPYKVNKRG